MSKFGYYALECSYLNNRIEEKTNYVEGKDEKFETMLLARGNNEESKKTFMMPWYWCKQPYMCGKYSMFVEPDELVNKNALFSDDYNISVKDNDNIVIRLKDGRH